MVAKGLYFGKFSFKKNEKNQKVTESNRKVAVFFGYFRLLSVTFRYFPLLSVTFRFFPFFSVFLKAEFSKIETLGDHMAA